MSLPFLSLGCHNLTAGSSRWRSRQLVSCALDLGITRFDVAPSYGLGTAEHMLSDALGLRRHDPTIEITTKFGQPAARHGALKAWLREPWRFVKQLRRSDGPAPSIPLSTEEAETSRVQSGDFVFPRKAAERSLRALRVERLGAFLTHEEVPHELCPSVLFELERLQDTGLIKEFGFSGETAHVLAMLEAHSGDGAIAQIALRDVATLTPKTKGRAFNISHGARAVLADKELFESLRDTLDGANFAAAMAGTIAFARRAFPDKIFLVNASTTQRLRAVVEPVAAGHLDNWVQHFASHISSVIIAKAPL